MKKKKNFSDYETCLETHASFNVTGNNLNPGLITKILKINPSYCIRRGDIHKGRHTRGIKASTGVWFFKTKGKVRSQNLEVHLVYLLKTFKRIPKLFYKIVKDEKLQVSIRCFWMSKYGHGGPEISKETLKLIPNLGLKLEFDFYSSV